MPYRRWEINFRLFSLLPPWCMPMLKTAIANLRRRETPNGLIARC